MTACGAVLRGAIEVSGKEFRVESDGEKWVHIIGSDGGCDTGVIDGNDVVMSDGECVTADWTSLDWKEFSHFVCG